MVKPKRWKGIKRAQRKFKLTKCSVCGSTEKLQRVHLDGDAENNSGKNVKVMCQACHARHDKRKHQWGNT